jgi:hypothetical protein
MGTKERDRRWLTLENNQERPGNHSTRSYWGIDPRISEKSKMLPPSRPTHFGGFVSRPDWETYPNTTVSDIKARAMDL